MAEPPAGAARPSFGAARLAEETRERFLREVAARVPADRIDECFLFAPIRHGGTETGVAVLAVRHAAEEAAPGEASMLVDVTPGGDPTEAAAGDAAPSEAPSDDAPAEDAAASRTAAAEPPARERHIVFVARYRLTVKGPDRGRWEMDVREEADAPLVTVEEVVRGVGRRAGDAAEPARLDREAVARLVSGAVGRGAGGPVAPSAG